MGMSKSSDPSASSSMTIATASAEHPVCSSHDYEQMKPIVLASWRLAQQSGARLDKRSEIIAESRVLQEVLPVPGSNVKLVYNSAKARGYLSTIELRLTPESIPKTLDRIHLRITIEGDLFEKTFEADPNLKFTYAWERLNIYRQRVYGTTTAVVKVGFKYSDCPNVVWDVQTTKILGQDLTASNIGGWDFHIHHRYNYQEGILYKGDGTSVFLKDRPKIISTLIGDGKARSTDCKDEMDTSCHKGKASTQKLLSPVAIAAASDGSLYIGDFDLIRRVYPDGRVVTVLNLKSQSIGTHRYYMAVHPRDDSLYFSDPESHQINRVLNLENPTDLENNFERVIGTGIRCLPGDENACGDGGLAKEARLVYPKGLAISADNRIYFADGTSIRMVDADNVITTLVGKSSHRNPWKPLSCEGSLAMSDSILRWPSDLAINPLDNTLHFIDDNLVMRITPDSRVQIVAGRPLHCPRQQNDPHYSLNFASQTTLVSPQSLTFSPRGQMFIAESDSRRINRVSVVTTDGRIKIYAGKDSKCNCQEVNCPCFEKDTALATDSIFGGISSVSVGANSDLFISDQVNRMIRTVRTSIPELTNSQDYLVYSPESQEVYKFNRFGLLLETRSIPDNQLQYQFSYSVSTSNGRLTGISDSTGSKIKIVRDYAGKVTAIENTLHQQFRLKLDRKKMLTALQSESNVTSTFSYHKSSELIQSKRDSSGQYYVFDYDENGRLSEAVTPTGESIRFTSDLELRGAVVNITRSSKNVSPLHTSLLIQPGLIQAFSYDSKDVIQMQSDRSFIANTKWGTRFNIQTAPYKVEGGQKSFPIASSQRTDIGRDTVNRMEWKYSVQEGSGSTKDQVGKRLRVNGEPILSVEVNRDTLSEILMLEKTQTMLNVSRNGGSLRISMLPSGLFAPLSLERNRIGQPVTWRWGERKVEFNYDERSRLKELKRGGDRKFLYSYLNPHSSYPEKVMLPTGGAFSFLRDDYQSLKSIMTPRGHIHGFSLQFQMGVKCLIYQAPWSREPYQLHFDSFGQMTAKLYPGEQDKIVHLYNHPGQVKATLGGALAVNYHYFPSTGLLKYIDLIEEEGMSSSSSYKMRSDFKYHLGLLKELRLGFDASGPKTILDPLVIKYQYDGSARISGITTTIGDSPESMVSYKYDSTTGHLESVHDLRIRRESLRKVVIEDMTKVRYSCTKDLDKYGRLSSVTLRIRGSQQLFHFELKYNKLNHISQTKLTLNERGEEIQTRFSYNPNDQIESVETNEKRGGGGGKKGGADGNNWIYTHDVNGNIVSAQNGGKKVSLGYDGGDRIIMYGDVDYVTYDDRGFIVRRGDQHYTYNALGQMTTASQKGRFSIKFFYDYAGRLIAKRDHKGNVVQFVYADVYKNQSVTHVHYPKASRTYRLFYDDIDNHLIAMDTPDDRFYVGTDHLGSPLAVFDGKGNLVREISRSPFGRTVFDSNPGLDVPIGFAGGLVDQYTLLVHFEGSRVYDPILRQWMTPDWEKPILSGMRSPMEIFGYRFRQNNPVASVKEMAEMESSLMTGESISGNVSSKLGMQFYRLIFNKCDRNAISYIYLIPLSIFLF